MKLKITIILILLSAILFSSCSLPDMRELQLNKDPNLYAGEGEFCENQYLKLNCADGLECRLISSKPYIIRMCYPPGKELDEDFINKQIQDNANYVKAQGINSTPTE